jgi:hypothetical protein
VLSRSGVGRQARNADGLLAAQTSQPEPIACGVECGWPKGNYFRSVPLIKDEPGTRYQSTSGENDGPGGHTRRRGISGGCRWEFSKKVPRRWFAFAAYWLKSLKEFRADTTARPEMANTAAFGTPFCSDFYGVNPVERIE